MSARALASAGVGALGVVVGLLALLGCSEEVWSFAGTSGMGRIWEQMPERDRAGHGGRANGHTQGRAEQPAKGTTTGSRMSWGGDDGGAPWPHLVKAYVGFTDPWWKPENGYLWEDTLDGDARHRSKTCAVVQIPANVGRSRPDTFGRPTGTEPGKFLPLQGYVWRDTGTTEYREFGAAACGAIPRKQFKREGQQTLPGGVRR